jgi:magnesium transporter
LRDPGIAEQATILLVDDTPDNLALMSGLLKNRYKVKVATSGLQALAVAASKPPPSLILLDIVMPVMDGYEVCQRLKRDPRTKDIPLIFLTGRGEAESEEKGLALGAVDYITKPISTPIVMARVRTHLALKAMQDALRAKNGSLKGRILEVVTSHKRIRQQAEEVRELYDKIVAEQQRSAELSLQPGKMVGLEQEERLATRFLRSLRLRHPWLQANLLTAFAAGTVVGLFQGTIDRLLILTIFLPVLAGQSGNTGSQALAITLRGIVLGELRPGMEVALVRKEALLGLFNGALVGIVAALGMYVVATSQHSPNAPMLSTVVFLAMIGSCIISGIFGAIVPLTLKRFGTDPVTASTMFLTTATDVTSMGMLLGLAALLVK